MNSLIRQLLCNALLMVALPAAADIAEVTRVLHQEVVPEQFSICYGGGCAAEAQTGLSDEEWADIREIFDEPADDAETERELIARAIALLERIVGPKTGTDGDRGGTFGNSAYPGQMDCNDESANTTTYLKLLEQQGLLRFYKPVDTKTRAFFFNGWPHSTAVMQEHGSNRKFAVDSWFFDNGEPPVIIPLELWQSGWKPAEFK